MQTENTAPAVDTTTTAPAGQVDANQTTTPPASGQGDQGTAPPADGTSTTAEGKTEQGTQQDADQAAAERDEQGRFKSKVQKRIDELTHARHTAEREAARWRAIAEGKQTAAAPQAHEFASDEDFQAALLDHRIDQRAQQQAAANAKQAADQYQQDAQRAVADTYSQRVEAAAARIPDFVEVVGKADIQISNALRDALMDSEHGPDIVYQLARNPAEAARLSQLPERQLFRELGRMEAAMVIENPPARTTAAPAARTTSAPAPASTAVVGGAPPSNDPAKMSQAEFEAWRRSQGSKYV